MERNREVRRGVGGAGGSASTAPRRPRVSGPKDGSDEDERMDDTSETRAWERPKKERINSFHLSASANPRNKRKRQGPPEAQVPGRSSVCDDADESAEETENAASDDDDEPPPLPILRRPGKSRGNGKVKSEDEIVMDIPAVPRKARSLMSSSSRFTPSRRQPESHPSDSSRQQSPVAPQTSLNGISSSNILGKPGRRLKSGGAKIRGIKVPKVSEPSTISDKEVEVAEALFDLARSFPSHSATTLDQKAETKVESEVKAVSPSHVPALSPALPIASGHGSSNLQASGSNANGNTPSQIQSVTLPTAEAPKRKRPRIAPRQEEGRAATPVRAVAPGGGSYSSSPSGVMHSPGGEAEQTTLSERSQSLPEEALSVNPEASKAKVTTESSHPVPQVHDNEETNVSSADYRSKVQVDPKDSEENLRYNSDTHEWKAGRTESRVSSPSSVKVEASAEASENNDGCAKMEFPSRPTEFFCDNEDSSPKLKIDLMAPPTKSPLKDDSGHDVSVGQHKPATDISINLTSHLKELPPVKVEHLSDSRKDADNVDVGLKDEEMTEESRKIKERTDGENKEPKEEQKDQTSEQIRKEQMPSLMQREAPGEGEREKDRDSAKLLGPGQTKPQKTDAGALPTSSFLMSTFPGTGSSNNPVALAGWVPPFGYYGSGAPPWAGGASLPGASVDGKTAHPAVQLPHVTVLPPVQRMNHCATHVYLAHFIYREQQRVRHALWPATLCRGTPYNLNIPPVSMLEKEKMVADPARKAPPQQAGLAFGFSVSQSSAAGVTGNGGTLSGITNTNSVSAPSLSSAGGVPVESGSGTAAGSVMNMAQAAQYIPAMMHQTGLPPYSFPPSFPPPGQAQQYFNGPFYHAHLMSTIPQLQSLVQQGPNMQKQQQGLRTAPHSTSSQLLPPAQQQLQLQLAPQSPSNSQQPHQVQQHHHHHMGASTQQFGAHSEEDSTVGGESLSTADSRLSAIQRSICGQGHSNLPNLNISPSSLMLTSTVPALPSHHQDGSVVATLGGKHTGKPQSVQQQQLIPQNTGPSSGLLMKGLDQSISQGYPPMTISSVNRGSVGPSPLGLVSVASVLATQGHAVMPGASENTRVHGPQQPVLGGQNQQYHQRALPRVPVSTSDETFVPSSSKGREFIEERKSAVKQIGGPLNLTRVDMEVSSPSAQGSPTSGSNAPAPRLANNLGRTLNLPNSTGARNSRPVSSVGTAGQVPHSQNQTSKQVMARAKGISGSGISQVTASPTGSSYALPGNLGKIQGAGLPFAGQMTPCSQGLKQGPASIVKVGQRTSQGAGVPAASSVPPQAAIGAPIMKNSGQQARTSQPGPSTTGTPPRMPPGSTPMLPSGPPISISTSNPQSVLKAAAVPASKSPSNGKGTGPTSKSGPVSVKRSSVSGPALSSVVVPGQNMSVKSPLQQKSQGQSPLQQFSQQHVAVAAQHHQLGTKHQVYHQQQPQQGSQFKQSFPTQSQYRPQSFLQQHHPQYLQQSSLQQQSLSQQQTQQPSTHYFQQNPQNSSLQHGHTHQHLRHDQHHLHLQQQSHSMSMSTSASPTTNNGLSLSPPNLTLGTGLPGNSSVIMNTEGADHGPSARSNPPKATSSPGNQLSTGSIPKNSTALHPSGTPVSGQQIGNPHSGSSHYLQLAPVLGVKSTDQKTLPESVSREEFSGIRHLPSSSNTQPPLVSNPSSS